MDRVLEIGGYAAAYAGRLFVTEGADVVRVDLDPPAPAWAGPESMNTYLHTGKRRVALADAGLLADLAASADVVVVDGPGADAVGALGFDTWATPVRVALTPFGLTGPRCNWRATPNVLLAMGGYTHLMGDAGRAPLSLPGHFLEFQAGALAFAAANAVRLSQAPGRVDIALFETLLAMSQFTMVRWHCAGEARGRHGSDFWYVAPSDLFRCLDGWVYVNIVPQFWDPFTVLLDRPELLLDERFATNEKRMAHRDVLYPMIADALGALSKVEVDTRAAACRVPLGVVRDLGEVLGDPQLEILGMWEPTDSGQRLPGRPWRFAGARRHAFPQ